MAEQVKCPLCGFTFSTDIQGHIRDGTTIATRGIFDIFKPGPAKIESIDITCPQCEKEFRHVVGS